VTKEEITSIMLKIMWNSVGYDVKSLVVLNMA